MLLPKQDPNSPVWVDDWGYRTPYGEYNNPQLPPFFPNLSPDEMGQTLDMFGWQSPVDAYPADTAPSDVAGALMSGMGPSFGGLHQMLMDAEAKKGGLKSGLKKAAPYIAAAAIHALTSQPAGPKPLNYQLKAGDTTPIANLQQPGRQAPPVQVQTAPLPPAPFSYQQRLGGY